MRKFILQRLASIVVTLWLLATIVFMLVSVLPAPKEDVAAFNAQLGTDKPLFEQYVKSMKRVFTLDFGTSYQTRSSVSDIIFPALGRSGKLAVLAFIFTIPISIFAGIYAARRKDKLADRVIVNAGLASSSIPEFVTAAVLLAVFAVELGWGKAFANPPDGTSLFGQLEYLWLPAMAMAIAYFGYIARMTRAGVITALNADYTRTATMKGMSSSQVMRRHNLRNALAPTITVISVQIGYLIGAVIGVDGRRDAGRRGRARRAGAAGRRAAGGHRLHAVHLARRPSHRLPQSSGTSGDHTMSDLEQPPADPDEVISSPGIDMFVPGHAPTNAPLNERKQARRENWRLIRRRPAFLFGVFILTVWVICALLGERITPHDPLDFRAGSHLSPRWEFPFGTDATGRDVLSRVMAGARDVLRIAPLAAFLGVLFGVILGMLMGYLRGWFDTVASRIVEAFLALPVVLIALLAVTTLGSSSWVVTGVVAALFTPIVARTVRSAVLAERDLDYVTSARLRGECCPT